MKYSIERGSTYYTNFMKKFKWLNPLCADPFNIHKILNETVPAKDVHHIIPYNKDISKCYDNNNLISLCPICHRAIHGDKKSISYILDIIGLKKYKETKGYTYFKLQQ